jgi:hypothetical protein
MPELRSDDERTVRKTIEARVRSRQISFTWAEVIAALADGYSTLEIPDPDAPGVSITAYPFSDPHDFDRSAGVVLTIEETL